MNFVLQILKTADWGAEDWDGERMNRNYVNLSGVGTYLMAKLTSRLT